MTLTYWGAYYFFMKLVKKKSSLTGNGIDPEKLLYHILGEIFVHRYFIGLYVQAIDKKKEDLTSPTQRCQRCKIEIEISHSIDTSYNRVAILLKLPGLPMSHEPVSFIFYYYFLL